MLEDAAGHQIADTRRTYATCAECGQVFARREARVYPAGVNDDARSEFTELCPECERRDLEDGPPVTGEFE
jgi:hypothetical protein